MKSDCYSSDAKRRHNSHNKIIEISRTCIKWSSAIFVGTIGSVAVSLMAYHSLSIKFGYVPQALEYRINWERYNQFAGGSGMLLHINGKFTMGKLKSFLLS
jgi:hypothetical protein